MPIRFAPTTSGAKSATITINSNDPATPNKVATLAADTPDLALCNPPSFTAVGLSIGPTFGSSRLGDYTFTGNGRFMAPFGEKHNFGFQGQGDYHYYHGLHEGQIDAGLMDRWKVAQFGVFASFKFGEVSPLRDGGVLGQGAAVLDLLFPAVRVSFFGTKGFKDIGELSRETTFTFVTAPAAGSTAATSSLQHVTSVVDTIGGASSRSGSPPIPTSTPASPGCGAPVRRRSATRRASWRA